VRKDRKIKGEGRMLPKCARLLSGARPSVRAEAIQPPRRQGLYEGRGKRG